MALQPWASVDWTSVLALVVAQDQASLSPLLQASLDSIQQSSSQLCGMTGDTCVAGIFALRMLAIYGLVRQGRITDSFAVELSENETSTFGMTFSQELNKPYTLNEEFGRDRQAPLNMFQVGLQMLGRLLHTLARLPPADGAAPGFSEFESEETESTTKDQFAFGENWRQFVDRITVDGIVSAVREVRRAFAVAATGLRNLRILDLGCGSGLHSLAFHLLGSNVTSADVQEAAVQTTDRLRTTFSGDDSWSSMTASALHAQRLSAIGPFDVVYSWGVLHHTGDMWQALHNVQLPLKDDGLLLVALYAAEFYEEKVNLMRLKRAYRAADATKKTTLEIALGLMWLRPLLAAGTSAFEILRNFTEQRGMDFWTDVRDWLGGWPMDLASTTEVLAFAKRSGLKCVSVRRYGGNTEFALTRPAGFARWTAGRTCVRLDYFVEDVDAGLEVIQLRFYARKTADKPIRRWWKHSLPGTLATESDRDSNPQRDRMLLLTADFDPFGYPSAQFARPDALRDPKLAFFAFWEGVAYASPIGGTADGGVEPVLDMLQGVHVCLMPLAELTPEFETDIRDKARIGLAKL